MIIQIWLDCFNFSYCNFFFFFVVLSTWFLCYLPLYVSTFALEAFLNQFFLEIRQLVRVILHQKFSLRQSDFVTIVVESVDFHYSFLRFSDLSVNYCWYCLLILLVRDVHISYFLLIYWNRLRKWVVRSVRIVLRKNTTCVIRLIIIQY